MKMESKEREGPSAKSEKIPERGKICRLPLGIRRPDLCTLIGLKRKYDTPNDS